MSKSLSFIICLLCCAAAASAQQAFTFNGTSSYLSFGAAPALGLSTFTLEVWFRRTGAGVGATSGSGGISGLVPLITKGRGESDGGTMDCNYIFGIANNKLAADFEEGTGQTSPGLNHPVTGSTTILNNVWYHAAVTFDGNRWRLYLNGVLDGELVVGRLPQALSIQHAGLGTAMNTLGVPEGYFAGVLDEARIWNYARPQQAICDSSNLQLSAAYGLVGRWALNDTGSATTVAGNGTSAINGTRFGTPAPTASGSPYNVVCPIPNRAPAAATGFVPKDDSVYGADLLKVTVSDPDTDRLKVVFLGREHTAAADSPAFTIIPIPDVQYYTSHQRGGTNSIFQAQMKWIVDSIASRNIAYAIQLGDCTDHGDNNGDDIEWKRADTSLSILENPVTTGMKDGLPYGVCVGNHDQWPNGVTTGTTIFYNQYFGYSRFAGRGYYGGHFGTKNNNHYQLFSASGFDFIAISFEYDTAPDADVLAWGDSLLKAYPARRGIICSHYFITSTGAWGPQGLATYEALKGNPNLDFMLCGHINPNGEARRSDTWNGHTTHTMLSDYQDRAAGGNGWIRSMEFIPAMNKVSVKTYSPTLQQYERDDNSEFMLDYNMSEPWDTVGIAFRIPSGNTASVIWNGLQAGKQYDWYTVTTDPDGASSVSDIRTFTYRPVAASVSGQFVSNGSLVLYPNPTDGRNVYLDYPQSVPATVYVLTAGGQQVFTGDVTLGSRVRLPVSLEVGIYFVQVRIGSETMTRKLVVQ